MEFLTSTIVYEYTMVYSVNQNNSEKQCSYLAFKFQYDEPITLKSITFRGDKGVKQYVIRIYRTI